MLMHPEAPKREEDIAEVLEKWCEQERLLHAHGDEYKMNAAFKVTALRLLMSTKREQFELMEREAKAHHGDKITEGMFEDLLNKVREYAAKRRLEAHFRKNKGDPMDIGQIHEQEHAYESWSGQEEYQWNDSVDALSKGKAKGKGKKGKGKANDAKGKGKGPVCWTCGEQGHTCWNCTKNPQNSTEAKGWNVKGKGWSKGGNKGKGKGANEVDYEQEYWNQVVETQED